MSSNRRPVPSDLVLTLDTYGHLWPDSEEATRVAVDGAFLGLIARSAHAGTSVSE